jgi:hypothetical protein
MPSGSLNLQSMNFGVSSRRGDTNVFGDMTFGSAMQNMNLGATTLGFGYTTGESGRSLALSSTFDPPTMMETIRLGAMGINPTAQNPALALHGIASAGILQLTDRQGKMSATVVWNGLKASWALGRAAVTTGRMVFNNAERGREQAENKAKATADPKEKSAAKSATGGPKGQLPDGEDPEKKEKKYKINDDNADPSLPVGHRKPGETTPKFQTGNEATKIGDTNYTGHALDEMRAQGLTPSVVEQVVQKGASFPGKFVGTTVKYDSINNISVVVNSEGSVVTTSFGKLAGVK